LSGHGRTGLDALAAHLVDAWGCWGPTLTADGRQMAYISDRSGSPALWIQSNQKDPSGATPEPHRLSLSADPVLAAHWSPDGSWLACGVASGGGVRSEVWVIRPDGTGGRRVAGGDGRHAVLGPWARRGHRVTVTVHEGHDGGANRCLLLDPATGFTEDVAAGPLLRVLDLSEDERFVLCSDGPRGAERCWLLDRASGRVEDLLPFPSAGATQAGILRPADGGADTNMIAYLVTDAGLRRRGLVAVPIGADGHRGHVGAIAQRSDGELDMVDADRDGRTLVLVWNVGGLSEVELIERSGRDRRPVASVPGTVVGGGVLSRDGSRAVLSVESPHQPLRLFELAVHSEAWTPLTAPSFVGTDLVIPTLERLESHDGLAIEGWLYRAPSPRSNVESDHPEADGPAADQGPPPALVYLHGGPEAQERPGFNPHHQLLAAAGISVFAANIRGSAGYGRSFQHADDRYGRLDAIGDIAACAGYLVDSGLADRARVAVAGRSYGGYAALMALAHSRDLFVAAVDVCGMSDLLTFFRDTEPWIAAAAVTKYGDPRRDAWLLARLSPMRHVKEIRSPLLVVHGELDTNVPLGEARQIVGALRALGRPVEYLELRGEGHEYRRSSSRLSLLRAELEFLQRTLVAAHEQPGSVTRNGVF
jgi:dipeptidyl aminopeptidase/acylaminoacyl peptidase